MNVFQVSSNGSPTTIAMVIGDDRRSIESYSGYEVVEEHKEDLGIKNME